LVLNNTANALPSGIVIAERNEVAFSQTPGLTDLEALAAYDTNTDGKISSLDARWAGNPPLTRRGTESPDHCTKRGRAGPSQWREAERS
jgi:hypothetical protein